MLFYPKSGRDLLSALSKTTLSKLRVLFASQLYVYVGMYVLISRTVNFCVEFLQCNIMLVIKNLRYMEQSSSYNKVSFLLIK